METNRDISNAEWIVLRIILNHSPIGSRDIIRILNEKHHWSTATVKTFLARLVKKNAIGYTAEKNAFFYYPLVTEMSYVKSETKAFFAKIYGGSIVHETEHFRFSGDGSKEYLDSIATILESNYVRIANDLEYTQTSKQPVYIHSSLKLLHSALGFENGPSWMTTGSFWEILHVAPENVFVSTSPKWAVLHSFAQLLMHRLNPNAPFWLVQGISVYEANWLSFDQLKNAITIEQNQLNAYSVYRVPTIFNIFKDQRGYELTYTVIQYIVEKYGKDALRMYLKSPELLRDIFKCSEVEFWESWVQFVKSRYLTDGFKDESMRGNHDDL